MLQEGAYRRLLDAYYIREKPLPVDVREVCRLVRAQSKPDRKAVEVVLREFFEAAPDGWRHSRCDREIARFQDKQRKAKASAGARWSQRQPQSERNANASPDEMRTHSEGNASRARSQAPGTSPQPPVTKRHSSDASQLRDEERNSSGSSAEPTPTLAGKRVKRDSLNPPDRPAEVGEQIWADWCTLRRAKRAPVTATVVDEARRQAEMAAMPLEDFLRIWCSRGSQGLQADWLKPQERTAARKPAAAFAEIDYTVGIQR